MLKQDQLKVYLESEVWRDILLPRFQSELMRRQLSVINYLRKGDVDQSHQSIGWCDALNMAINLPVQMVREIETKEKNNG